MLIHLGPSGLEALLHTINASWRTARVPGAWRCADIVPVLKKNKDPSLPKAYRPVCLTSCIAKTAERLVRLRTQHIIEKWRLLNHEQAGFRRGRSAEEQLAWTTQTISDALERGEYALMIAIDFEAAFDHAWRLRFHQKLLNKGFPPAAVRWFMAFLSQRMARVRVADMYSKMREFFEGFPQGTILGPLMWDVFVDDIIPALRAGVPGDVGIELYADDIVVILCGPHLKDLERRADAVLKNLKDWTTPNKATVSMDKSSVTVFTATAKPLPEKQRPKLKYNGQPLKYDPSPTLLGVVYDELLSFTPQADKVCERMRKGRAILGAAH
eukprot:gene58084-biopygen3070